MTVYFYYLELWKLIVKQDFSVRGKQMIMFIYSVMTEALIVSFKFCKQLFKTRMKLKSNLCYFEVALEN